MRVIILSLTILIFTLPAYAFTQEELTTHNCHPCVGNNGESGYCCEFPFEYVECDEPEPEPEPDPTPEFVSKEIDVSFSTPDEGNLWEDSAGLSAEYPIENMKPGDYIFSAYGNAPNAASDSIHFGIDGNIVGILTLDVWESPSPKWSDKLQGGGEAIISISDNGLHNINIWAREDGCEISKIKLEHK